MNWCLRLGRSVHYRDEERSHLIGWVDSYSSDAVSGWYVHPIDPMKICCIALNLENGDRLITTNGLQRPDIARIREIPGLCAGFSFAASLKSLGESRSTIVSLEFPFRVETNGVGAVRADMRRLDVSAEAVPGGYG